MTKVKLYPLLLDGSKQTNYKIIGEGSFGRVAIFSELPNKAVKVFKMNFSLTQDQLKVNFTSNEIDLHTLFNMLSSEKEISVKNLGTSIAEIKSLSCLNHPYIIYADTICLIKCEKKGQFCLGVILPLASASLDEGWICCLRGQSKLNIFNSYKTLDNFYCKTLFSFVDNLLNALAYLDGLNLTHSDFKSANILIFKTQGKISDLSEVHSNKLLQKLISNQDAVFTSCYRPPEVWEHMSKKFEACSEDMCKLHIFSLGLVIWDLFYKTPLFSEIKSKNLEEDLAIVRNKTIILQSLRDDGDFADPILKPIQDGIYHSHPLLSLAIDHMLQSDPKMRMNAQQLLDVLDSNEFKKDLNHFCQEIDEINEDFDETIAISREEEGYDDKNEDELNSSKKRVRVD